MLLVRRTGTLMVFCRVTPCGGTGEGIGETAGLTGGTICAAPLEVLWALRAVSTYSCSSVLDMLSSARAESGICGAELVRVTARAGT
jgi:hypothetical protein